WLASARSSSSVDANSRTAVCFVCASESCCCSCGVSLCFCFITASSGFGEERGEGFACAMQLAAHGVGGLARQRGDFVVTHFLVGDEQQEQAILGGQTVESFLNPLAEFLILQHEQRRVGARGGV